VVRRAPEMPSPTLPERFWSRWEHYTSAKSGWWGLVLLVGAILLAVAQGIDAVETLSKVDWVGWLLWAWDGVAYAMSRPWMPVAIALVGLALIASVPAPKPLPPPPLEPPSRPEEAIFRLRQLDAHGMQLAADVADAGAYFRYAHEKALRQWAADIAGAASLYFPGRYTQEFLRLRQTMRPHAGNATQFIQVYLNRTQEMLDALLDSESDGP